MSDLSSLSQLIQAATRGMEAWSAVDWIGFRATCDADVADAVLDAAHNADVDINTIALNLDIHQAWLDFDLLCAIDDGNTAQVLADAAQTACATAQTAYDAARDASHTVAAALKARDEALAIASATWVAADAAWQHVADVLPKSLIRVIAARMAAENE